MRAFEQHVFARLDRVEHEYGSVGHERREAFRVLAVVVISGFEVHGFAAVNRCNDLVLDFDILFEFFAKNFGLDKVAHTDTDTLGFVHIARTDAVFGRSDVLFATRDFAQLVDLDVVGKNDVRTRVDLEIFHGNAARSQVVDFL